jgi:diguanylate cyclase (GGDEF)-like protein/PAS domain S-box-containing protein
MEASEGPDLLQTLLEVLPQATEDRLIQTFLTTLNNTYSIQARLLETKEEMANSAVEEIFSGTHSFGWIEFSGRFSTLPAAAQGTLRAAVRLLALILENKRSAEVRRAGESMNQERNILTYVMETSPAGILMMRPDGQITFKNWRASQLLHFHERQVPLTPEWTMMDIYGQPLPPEKQVFQRVVATRRPVYGARVILRLEDGSRIPLMVNASPLLGAKNEVSGLVVVILDISQMVDAEEALRNSEERYALAVNGANDGIWDWNLQTGEVYYSPRWVALTGSDTTGEAFGDRIEAWFSIIHPADYWQFKADISAHINGDTPYLQNQHRILHKDGLYRWVLARGMAVRDAAGAAYRIAGSLTDIQHQKTVEEQLMHDAMHDPLTHLPNRAYFIDQVRRSIDRARRDTDYHGAVLFLDLDRFKVINESLGHASGDQLLVAIARRLQAILRPRDMASRFGGDEFAILLDDITGVGDATRIAQRIQEELGFPYRIQEHEIFPGASIGIAMITHSTFRAEDVLRDADTAMYRAKAGGRGRHEVFGTEMHAMNVALFEMETDLRRAVERHQLQLYYQPIIALDSGRIHSVEALLRWHHPRRGLILPGEFIILAEETGLMLPIGEWVLRTACQQAKSWRDAGYTDLCMAVNISPRQMQDGDLPALVRKILDETGLPAEALQLEITEWAAMQDLDLTVKVLQTLRDMGVLISIDDFGTSYSSLGYLKRFPVSSIKIDQSFVRDMTENLDDAAITKAIIAMGNVLGLKVVAEGVELEQQLVLLNSDKCDHVQGDLMGRPVPAEAITTLLQEGHTLLPDMSIPVTGKKRGGRGANRTRAA